MTQLTFNETNPWPGSPWLPRRWQAEALPEILGAIERGEATVAACATGSGKSIVIAELAARLQRPDAAIVVTTPTQRLVDQLAATISQRCHGAVGQYFARAKDTTAPIIVTTNASARSLAARLRRPVGMMIVDECHGAVADQVTEAHRILRPERIVGFTATPFRANERERLKMFDRVCYRYTLGDGIRDGVITRWTVKSWHGDPVSLDEAVVAMIRKHAEGPGIVNASSIEDAERCAVYLTDRGIAAEAVHSRRHDDDNSRALARLKAGALRCVVHVQMLTEGVDYPWLRWHAGRRPISSRNAFIQEAGRILRAVEGKASALFLDPLGLFGVHSWSHEEALGEWNPQDVEAVPAGEGQRTLADRYAEHVDEVTAYCRRLLMPMQAAGLVEQGKITSIVWRHGSPTDKAVNYLGGLGKGETWRRLPGAHSVAVRRMIEHRRNLTAGAVADLIELTKGLDGHEYPAATNDVDGVDPSVLDALAEGRATSGDDTWYAAGVWRKDGSTAALSVFHGGRSVGVRVVARHGEETWLSLQLRAILYAAKKAAAAGDPRPLIGVESWPACAVCWGRYRREMTPREAQAASKLREWACKVTTVGRGDNPATVPGFIALKKNRGKG